MKVGDLVSHKHSNCGILGIILEISQPTATVAWFEHEIFGEHECYEMIDDLNSFNKNT
jgi:hypothetical protein